MHVARPHVARDKLHVARRTSHVARRPFLMPLYARRFFLTSLLIALAAGGVLRTAWLTADPPTHATVGIVWHDEGAWVHNARNRVLWGTWRTDNWNPMFIAPVFTGLEYIAFSQLGVGTWQARTVSVAAGLVSILFLALGLAATGGRRAAAAGAVLLATNYVFVMWNRAALMESTMTAFIVASWCGYALSRRWPVLGLVAGAAVVAAWFTKASAAFFVAALLLDAGITLILCFFPSLCRRLRMPSPEPAAIRAAWWTVGGVCLAAGLVVLLLARQYWTEYWFYNWQTSVARKPSYTIRALLDRASWIPIAHDFFTRMWLVTVAGAVSILGIVVRWRTARPAERLLVWWVLVGMLELVVHDSGNERRYVMFIPAFVALASLLLSQEQPAPMSAHDVDPATRVALVPLLLAMSYIVIGALGRLPFLYDIGPGVRLSAALAALTAALVIWRWRSTIGWLGRQRMPVAAAAAIVALAVAGDLAQYWQWTRHRTSRNYEASLAVGRALPPGTLVHGKLANGLSLENSIRPVFVGRGFGNYEDRKQRNDVRYILTYVAPALGYEGPVILDVLLAYPKRAVIMTFDVAETTAGGDRAALFDKFGGAPATPRSVGAQD
jgi:hypothetical protein